MTNEMKKQDLFEQILDLDHQVFQEIVTSHKLGGILYKRYQSRLKEDQKAICQRQYQENWYRNDNHQRFYTFLTNQFPKHLNFIPLKGMALLGDIYPDTGERFLSDIDLYITKEQKNEFFQHFLKLGFKPIGEKRWWGNHHKMEWEFQFNDMPITCETHTQLFYHLDKPINLESFSKEEHFLYLCGHLIFQHTFQKLYWLTDLYLFSEKYSPSMDWKKIGKLAKEWKIEKSLHMLIFVLKRFFVLENSKLPDEKIGRTLQKELNFQFLISDNQRSLSYLKVKNLCKDSPTQALLYNLRWLLKV